MSHVSAVLKGTVHGKTIELEAESGLPDGQEVTVRLEPAPGKRGTDSGPLAALKRAAGSWADDPEGLDRFLEWNRQQRKFNRRQPPA